MMILQHEMKLINGERDVEELTLGVGVPVATETPAVIALLYGKAPV